MAKSIAQQIIDVIYNRILQISVRNGFNTNLGENTKNNNLVKVIDEISLTFPYSNLFIVNETPEPVMSERYRNTIRMAVEIFISESDSLQQYIDDVKSAVLLADDKNLGGLADTLQYQGWDIAESEAGDIFQAAVVTFSCQYSERYGDPYTTP